MLMALPPLSLSDEKLKIWPYNENINFRDNLTPVTTGRIYSGGYPPPRVLNAKSKCIMHSNDSL